MKTALVLQGGAMRGIYTAGVMDVFLEEGIEFDAGIGVSAGAVHGVSFVSKQKGRNIGYFKKYCADKRFMSVQSLLTTGNIFNVEFGYHDIPERLAPFDEEAYEANPMKFYVACTNIETGKPLYHLCRTMKGDDMDYLRASASMPLASKVVEIGQRKLLDGGITDNVPLEWMMGQGYEKHVVVLTQPRGYRKETGKTNQIYRIAYGRKYPKLEEALQKRNICYNEQIDRIRELEAEGKCFVICPSKDLQLSRIEKNPGKLQEQYDLGRRDAKEAIGAMRSYLSEYK